jgi:hypothetical protein
VTGSSSNRLHEENPTAIRGRKKENQWAHRSCLEPLDRPGVRIQGIKNFRLMEERPEPLLRSSGCDRLAAATALALRLALRLALALALALLGLRLALLALALATHDGGDSGHAGVSEFGDALFHVF